MACEEGSPFKECATQLRRCALAHKHKLRTMGFYQKSDDLPKRTKGRWFSASQSSLQQFLLFTIRYS